MVSWGQKSSGAGGRRIGNAAVSESFINGTERSVGKFSAHMLWLGGVYCFELPRRSMGKGVHETHAPSHAIPHTH